MAKYAFTMAVFGGRVKLTKPFLTQQSQYMELSVGDTDEDISNQLSEMFQDILIGVQAYYRHAKEPLSIPRIITTRFIREGYDFKLVTRLYEGDISEDNDSKFIGQLNIKSMETRKLDK